MKKRNHSSVGIYYIISIMCLVILFSGYGYIYRMSEKREAGKEIKTISLVDEAQKLSVRYNKLFARVMSYFNIFFRETFKEYEENGLFDENINNQLSSGAVLVEDGLSASIDNIDIYNYSEDNDEAYKTTVLLANNQKKDFFTIVEALNSASRLGLINTASKKSLEKINDSMEIILFHTHATEAYNAYPKTNYRTEDAKNNVVKIGGIISDNLNNLGLKVKHLKNYNDIPSFNMSYSNSKKLVQNNLEANKSNLIIDVHRDGADAESNYEKVLESVTRVKINNSYIATFSLVIGGENENIEKLKEIADIVKNTADELYPGLCRGIIVRDGAYFNQNISDYALLIEVGSNLNTIEEAKATADFISEILYNSILKINN